MDNQRLFLAIALGFILLMIWQAWQEQHAPSPLAASAAKATEVPKAPETPRTPNDKTAVSTPPPLSRSERVEIVTDLFQATIDTDGADLRDLRLRQYPVSIEAPKAPFRLMGEDGDIFIAQSGLVGHEGEFPTHKSRFTTTQVRYAMEQAGNELRIPFGFQARDGVRYTKTYIFHRGSYVIDIEFAVANGSRRNWSGYIYNQFQRTRVESGGLFAVSTYTGGAIYSPENKYEKISFDDMAKKPLKRDVSGGWVAMLQHYFVSAWLPQASERSQFYSDTLAEGRYAIGYKQLVPSTVAPGKTGVLRARLYAGPKEHRRLEALACKQGDLATALCDEKERIYSEGMELTVDYGWLTVLAAPLFWLLLQIHQLVGNWGWAIILLTILVKGVFYPLSAASYKSMAKMRRVQPKLEAIRQQHANDKQQLNQAMMDLYKTEKINPLGGCLPIVIQIPVFIALYWVLLESVEMRQAPWVLWIQDLSSKDPYYVLPLIMGASMFAQQKLSPQPPDPVQRKVFMVMPVMFTAMFVFFPAGLVLYWTVNNILSITQQWRINKVIQAGARTG